MKTYTGMIKCSIQNNCLDESIFGALKIYDLRGKIISHVVRKEPIPIELIKMFEVTYKEFSKFFFSRKTINCMFQFCKKKMPTSTKLLDDTLRKIMKLKKELDKKKLNPLIKSYKKIMRLLRKITIDFTKKYRERYLALMKP